MFEGFVGEQTTVVHADFWYNQRGGHRMIPQLLLVAEIEHFQVGLFLYSESLKVEIGEIFDFSAKNNEKS